MRKGIHKKFVITQGLLESKSEPRKLVDQYHRVEFFRGRIECTHQLKIWTKSTKSIDLMVEEKSNILQQVEAGNTLKILYYPTHSVYPCVYLETVIRHITKIDRGRLSGHYLVGLEALKKQD